LEREAVNEVLLTLLFFAVLALLYLLYRYFSLKSEAQEKYLSLKSEIEARARDQHEVWRERELQAIRRQYEEIARKDAAVQLSQWQQETEDAIRKDAIEKSRAVTLGKVTEHVVPFLPGFQHNPKDARFIGAPVDFIIFDGLDEGEVQRITFVEVKTGSSSLNKRERQIRNVVKQRSVEWEEIRIPTTFSHSYIPQREVLLEVTSEKICPHCGKGNREQAGFCGHCGGPLPDKKQEVKKAI
jgi:predicted Holliday junction resolvase-like endonuclease